MKKNVLKKVLATVLASTMVFSLTACGSSAEKSGGAETISFAVIDLNAGNNNVGDHAEEIMNQIEEYCGVQLDLQWVANDALAEKNSLFLASPNTMPQIMSWGGTVTGDVVSAAKNGAFVDLNDYIWDEEKYPNLSGMSKDVAANLTVDGKLIALPRTRVVGRYGLSYRQDWAEQVGKELPENATPDDVYDLLVAIKEAGLCEYPMEMCLYTGPFDIIQTWFGCGNGWAEVDGQLVPVWMQDEYFEAVDYIKKIYDAELMPQDWPSIPTDTWSNGCKTGKNAVYIDVLDSGKRIWNYFVAEETFTPSVIDPSQPASMVLYGAVNGHTLATAGYNGFFTLSASTLDSEEKIEAALTLLDKLNDPEMMVLTQFGLEGINYELDADGNVVKLDKEDEVLTANYKGLNQLLCFLPSTEATTVPTVLTERDIAQNEAYAAALPYAEVDPALSFKVGSETYAIDGATLDDEAKALRSQYICGSISMDELKAGLDNIRAKGYDKIIEEVNAQYQANK